MNPNMQAYLTEAATMMVATNRCFETCIMRQSKKQILEEENTHLKQADDLRKISKIEKPQLSDR